MTTDRLKILDANGKIGGIEDLPLTKEHIPDWKDRFEGSGIVELIIVEKK